MSDADRFRANLETKVTAEFGSERDAERVADAAVRLRESEEVEWNPSFVAEKMADAPRGHSVPEKWNWVLGHLGYGRDLEEYRIE
jgi:hypothetical protein